MRETESKRLRWNFKRQKKYTCRVRYKGVVGNKKGRCLQNMKREREEKVFFINNFLNQAHSRSIINTSEGSNRMNKTQR